MGVATQEQIESVNPATGERVGSVEAVAAGDVAAIVDDVAEVQPFWAQLPLSGRARYMRRAAQVLIDNLDELSALITREGATPRAETYSLDLVPAIEALHWIASHGERILAGSRPRRRRGLLAQKRASFSYEPLGVVGVIGSRDDPWSTPFGQVAVALMCGNGVVLKPAPEAALTGQRIQDVFERAGVPAGTVCVVHGGDDVGAAVVESSVTKVFFNGSPEAGRWIGVRCAELMKGSLLELGGNDAQLVLRDAPLEHAVAGCLWAAFANGGRAPAGIGRVYVLRDVAERFTEALVAGARKLRVGDPLEWTTDIGPLTSAHERDRLAAIVDDASAHGATLRCGGPVGVDGMSGAFYAPGVVTAAANDMQIVRERSRGPLVPVVEVAPEEEAVELANDSTFGLGASVWTLDYEKGSRIARRLDAGTVWLNDHLYSHGAWRCSWGGVKGSGLRAAHAPFAFYECVNVKELAVDRSHAHSFYWHPYDGAVGEALDAAVTLLYGRDADKRDALKRGYAPLAKLARRALRGSLTRE